MATVEGGLLNSLGFRGFRQLGADVGRGLYVSAVLAGTLRTLSRLDGRAGGGERHAGHVVDELGIDVLRRSEHAQPRALRRARDLAPYPVGPAFLAVVFESLCVHLYLALCRKRRSAAACEGLAFL